MMKHREHIERNLSRLVRPGSDDAQKADDRGMPAATGKIREGGPRSAYKAGGAVHHELGAKKRLDRLTKGRPKRDTGGGIPDPISDDAAREYVDTRGQHYASGGGVRHRGGKGKGKTVVNVMIGSPAGAAPAGAMPPQPPMPPPTAPMPPPPGPPPGAMPPPGAGGPPGGLPPQLAAALAAQGGGGPPMMGRKAGGRVTAVGSESGVGRLAKAALARRK